VHAKHEEPVSRWLSHENFLFKNTIKKGILNIKLAHVPSTSDGKGEDQTRWLQA
jgi:hypothetical protein